MSKIQKYLEKINSWRTKNSNFKINFKQIELTQKEMLETIKKIDQISEEKKQLKHLLKEQFLFLNDCMISAKSERDELKKELQKAEKATKEASVPPKAEEVKVEKANLPPKAKEVQSSPKVSEVKEAPTPPKKK